MQPGPAGGAQCAIHVGFPASSVCDRCGNFMCLSCSESGASTKCPACRALGAVSFPFDARASIGELSSHVAAAFQRDWVMLLIGALIFFAVVGVGSLVANVISTLITRALGLQLDPSNPLSRAFILIQVISLVTSTVVNIPLQAVGLLGFYRLLFDSLVGRKADVARMFTVLRLAPQSMLIQVVVLVFALAPAGLLGAMVGFLVGGSDSMPGRGALLLGALGFAVVLLVLLIVALPMMMFSTPELLIGGCGAVEAMRRAWKIGAGQRLRTLGYTLVMFLMFMLGVLLCCVGLVPAVIIGYQLLLALYLALRQSSGLPAPAEL